MLVDALGYPLAMRLTGGNVHDCTQALDIIDEIDFDKVDAFLADKGYDSDAIREGVVQQDCDAVTPDRRNRKEPIPYDKHLYKARHLVENTFAKLKQFRRIATRYDKTSASFTAFFALVSTFIYIAK